MPDQQHPASTTAEAYPWPGGCRALLLVLLGCAGGALVMALVGQAARWVPIAGLCLGLSLMLIAGAVLSVNSRRDDRARPFLLPARAGVVETRSRGLAWLYSLAFGGIGLFINVASGMILSKA